MDEIPRSRSVSSSGNRLNGCDFHNPLGRVEHLPQHFQCLPLRLIAGRTRRNAKWGGCGGVAPILRLDRLLRELLVIRR